MFYVYILYSQKLERYYVGQTKNVEERVKSHSADISAYTSVSNDWKLVYTESFGTKHSWTRLKEEEQGNLLSG